MKFDSPPRFTSFYESFSDLIFATLAIFVLIIMIIAVQVKSEDVVEVQSLELVIAVDGSGSMGEPLNHLKETIITLSKIMPKVSVDFRIGIVIYRYELADDVIKNSLENTYPIKQIHTDDGGVSFNDLRKWINKNLGKPINGPAEVEDALYKAIEMLSNSPKQDSQQILMLLGDQGPYEDPEIPLVDWKYGESEKGIEEDLYQRVKKWVNGSSKKRVVSIYTGEGLEPPVLELEGPTKAFFSEIAINGGSIENYSKNPGKMLAFLLEAILKEETRK